ncbi:hypothetical protein GF345_02630 [Candidatus Woesearchaeota archaeon]|nr:hypothetical protein [Candidatus Woesearchaeota archaeon]
MKRKAIMIICCIITFLAIINAVSAVITYSDLFITIKSIESNDIITSQPVELYFMNVNTGTSINLSEYLNDAGQFDYRINVGKWKLIVKLDKPSTPEIDYSAERTFLVEENNPTMFDTIYVHPAGSIEGSVVSPAGKLISDADVTIKCKSYSQSLNTDQFGSFKQELVPVGQCKVHAAFDDFVGSTDVNVTKGLQTSITVHLNKNLFSSTRRYIYVLIGVAVLAAIVFFLFRLTKRNMSIKKVPEKKKNKKKKSAAKRLTKNDQEPVKSEDAKEEKEELNPRARDIIKTLNEREKKVVDYLISQKDHKSTQATIRNNTGIPKTSLARIFQSLENKKVIEIESIGRLKRIILTDWFLGKE